MGSNKEHTALKRTNADKRRAVAEVLKECPKWSDRRIADHIGVSNNFVGELRRQLSSDDSSGTRIGADGKERKLPERPPTPDVTPTEGDDETQHTPPEASEKPAPPSADNPHAPEPEAEAETDAEPAAEAPAPVPVDALGLPIQPHAAEAFHELANHINAAEQ